jgi:hypothetical protein
VGARHALFPRTLTFGAQLHPSSFVGCQFPDAAPVAWTTAIRSSPAARPTGVSPPPECRVRLLSPVAAHLPVSDPGPGWNATETVRAFLSAGGRHPLHSEWIVGLPPRVLSLTPQVVFLVSGGRLPVKGTSRASDLIAASGSSPSAGAFPRKRSIRDGVIRFHAPAATPARFGECIVSSTIAGSTTTTLAHSNNFVVARPTVSARPPETTGGSASLGSRLVFPSRRFDFRVADRTASRLLPQSWLQGATTPRGRG